MNIFKETTWNGYELWLFKVAIFALGILVGVYFTDFCRTILPIIGFVGGIGTLLVTLIWWGKIQSKNKAIQ